MFDNRDLNQTRTNMDMSYLKYLSEPDISVTVPIITNIPMTTTDVNIDTIMQNILTCKNYINDFLNPIILSFRCEIEGNIFSCPELFMNKQKNISLISTKYNSVLEIGFNTGFSALLMLISNPNLKITCVDIGIHPYVLPCYYQLKSVFGDRIELIIGDSTIILPQLIEKSCHYELIHIDGSHEVEIAEKDIINTKKLSIPGKTIIIMDDMNLSEYHYSLVQTWIKYVNLYKYKEVDFPLFYCRWHDVILVP
jgi:hypothetical protein